MLTLPSTLQIILSASPLAVPEHDDSEAESSAKIVWALAWPAVLLNSLQVVNTLLDRGFIGHLDQAALTAHGASTNVMFLLFSLAMALATASTALVSRAFGARDVSGYRTVNQQCVNVTLFAGFLFAVIGVLIAPISAEIFIPAKDTAAKELMKQFLLVYAASLPAIFLIQSLAGALRGIGDTKSPMVISGLQIGLHIFLNCFLIFPTRQWGAFILPGAGLGLAGGALSLAISAWLSAVTYLIYSARTPLGQSWKVHIPTREWTTRILRIALPAAGQAILRVGALAAFTLVLRETSGGSVAIAAMGIGFAIESIMFMPAFGLSVAAASLVGQSLGMKKPDRAERLGMIAGHHSGLVILALSLPIFLGADAIAFLLVGGKQAVATEAALLIRTLCVTEVMFGYAMVMIGAMQGAGDTVRPMWITLTCLWLVRVPLAYLLAIPFGMGPAGAWVSMSLTQALQGFMAIILFKRGYWKLKKV